MTIRDGKSLTWKRELSTVVNGTYPKMKKVGLLLLTLASLSCNGVSEHERESIQILEKKFPNYTFSKSPVLSEVYLRIKLNEPRIDSVELKAVYQKLIEIKKRTFPSGQPVVNWMYLVIYNQRVDTCSLLSRMTIE